MINTGTSRNLDLIVKVTETGREAKSSFSEFFHSIVIQ